MKRKPTDSTDDRRQLLKWRLLVITGAAVIFVGSSIPGDSMPALRILTQDKLMHLLEYGVFGLLLANWGRLEFTSSSRVWIVLVVAALFALSDEFHQLLVGRSCEFYDWLADMVGVSLALGFTSLYYRRRGK